MPRQADRLSDAVLAYLQSEQQGRTPQQYFGFLGHVPEVFGEDIAGSGIPPQSIVTDHDGRIVVGTLRRARSRTSSYAMMTASPLR